MLKAIHISSFRCANHLATEIIKRQYANNQVCCWRLIIRGVKGRKVIVETFLGKLKDGISKKINGFIIYTEILFSTLVWEGKSGILFIWYNLIGLQFTDNFIQTTPPRQKTWFTCPCLCKSLHLPQVCL